jgi:phosphodiesterase/alkaline phosphatase D-like protein
MTRGSRSCLMIAISVIAIGLLFVSPQLARAQVNVSPTVESVYDTLAFIRWTTQNPGGTILHYAVVHYGKDPNHLDMTAESPTRINPGQKEMIFRVRMNNLQPETTYYYKVSSRQANGASDPATSTVYQFSTRPSMSARR